MKNESLRAVIDLGTNTFHLLIASVGKGEVVTEVYRERIFVKLASEGIERIGAAPFQRGIDALRHFAGVIERHGVSDLTAIGTAALRTADNGEVFVRTAELETGIAIRLIHGELEAELITRGVLAAIPPVKDRILIMDIGGGSTEYIVASDRGVHWRQSFPIGVAVLHRRFHHSDPVTEEEIREMEEFLDRILLPLREVLKEYPTHHLVGAAGTFDVMADVLKDVAAVPHPSSHQLALGGLEALHFKIISSNTAERLDIPGIPPERVDLIVVAMVLIRYTMKLAAIERITVSDYAMKEGILLSGSDQSPESPSGSA